MELIQKQCKRSSVPVCEADIEKVKADAKKMLKICKTKYGRYPFAWAIAHCQVNHDNPLRFFVTIEGKTIINPKIQESSGVIKQLEGCYSYVHRNEVMKTRYKKVKVKFDLIDEKGKYHKDKVEFFEDLWSRVFQHEIDHFNGMAIYS